VNRSIDWHARQDAQIDAAVASLDRVFAAPSAVRRVWALTDGFIREKHLLNVHSIKRRDDHFRLLDLGCGTGDLLDRLARQFPNAEFVGIDSNASSLARARALSPPRCAFFESRYEEAAPGIFDVIVCSEVYEHVGDPERLLDRLRDLLVPGGYLSMSTPSGWMFRVPRLYTLYKLLQNPKRFWRLYLQPERHWNEAVTLHPAILPSKLTRRLEARGFTLTLRQSALWWLEDFGVAYRTFRALERVNAARAATAFYHFTLMLEAAMNLCPVLRVFESRAVLLMRKRPAVASSE
jgi:2-polyprenyl-3-methyl-5-hydroxy-6-metoxy-1,4-benzoquinol methylase